MPKVLKKPAKRSAASALLIDYPQEGEQIRPGHYAVRLSTAHAEGVEISINSGQWQPCRQAVGYYWYDWTPAQTGQYTIVARPKKKGARKAVTRTCQVQDKR